jgi:exopolyphosphatase/guanosine-5'-triphosphate,3'-diphosphate pyrophosphatase
VAVVAGHRLEPLVDESVFLGLGDAVHDGTALGEAARGELVATLVRYAETGRRLGAGSVTFLGTEPIRRAADAARIVAEVGAAAEAPLHVLSHEEEAYLMLIGVTEGRPVAHDMLIVDIGGGSSEFALVGPDRPAEAWGLRLGSARLTNLHVTHDPPNADEVEAMTRDAREILVDAPEATPSEIVAVGGTASNLVKVLPAAQLDRTLSPRRLGDIQAVLGTEPAELAAERHLVNPVRAHLLPAGGAIVSAILERYERESVRVSEASLREGAVLAVEHAGPAWRDRLNDLAHGWRA